MTASSFIACSEKLILNKYHSEFDVSLGSDVLVRRALAEHMR